jgi:hypothetical protein
MVAEHHRSCKKNKKAKEHVVWPQSKKIKRHGNLLCPSSESEYQNKYIFTNPSWLVLIKTFFFPVEPKFHHSLPSFSKSKIRKSSVSVAKVSYN